MPEHADFQKIHQNFIQKYGKKKGDEVYYSWLNKHKLDDKKSMPKHLKGESGDEYMEKEVPFDVLYNASIDDFKIVAEQVELDGQMVTKEKVVITGTLMDDQPNKNDWIADRESFSIYAEDCSKIPVKVQHLESDWEIIGSGLQGYVEGDSKIKYIAQIIEPRAVNNFKSGVWDKKFMGISPRIIGHTKAECNICANDMRDKNCGHVWGKTYNGKKCMVTPKGGHLSEMSLTSTPAYAPRAGTIDSISFAASLKEQIEKMKIEGEQMTENVEFEKQISDLSSQLKIKEEKITDYEAKLKEVSSSLEQMKRDNDTLKGEVSKFKAEVRRAELAKLIGDEAIIASIIKKEMTDEEFKAEFDILEKVSSVKIGGSLPIEGTKSQENEFEANWGFKNTEDAVKSFY